MRWLLASFLVLASAPALASPPEPPRSAAILLRFHPAPWQPPALTPAPMAGMRVDPETGEAVAGIAGAAAASMSREQAEASVRVEADGSLHAVLGGAIRSYLLVHVRPDGTLEEDCVPSASEAIRRINAAAPAQHAATKKEGR